jgi:hypothetical protein
MAINGTALSKHLTPTITRPSLLVQAARVFDTTSSKSPSTFLSSPNHPRSLACSTLPHLARYVNLPLACPAHPLAKQSRSQTFALADTQIASAYAITSLRLEAFRQRSVVERSEYRGNT